jgi:hypothetical protein
MPLKVQQESQYKGNDLWDWSVWLDGTRQELQEIDYVEYNLGSSFHPPKRTVEKRSSKFRLSAPAGGPFTIYVKAIHKDKKETTFEHDLELLYPGGTPRNDESLNSVDSREMAFANGNKARCVLAPANSVAAEILQALRIGKPRALILLSGGGDELPIELVPRLTQLFSRGVARAANEAEALIIDGGTKSGVMEIMGRAVADAGRRSALLGIAPASKVAATDQPSNSDGDDKAPLDPNHSHFVLVDCDDWGCEIDTRYALAKELVGKGTRVVTLVANGGRVTAQEVVWSVRHQYPIIVIEGSGRLADEIADAWRKRPDLPSDPAMAEIIADGRIELHPLSAAVGGAERLILRKLGGDNVLLQAWERFAVYDLNAVLLQKRFFRFQFAILSLGLLATALALIKQRWNPPGVYYILLVIPIILTILITVTNRFKQGNKWLLLRGGAEAIKREIYKYRAKAGDYKELLRALPAAPPKPGELPPPPPPTPEQVLAQKVEDVTRRVMQTEVNTSSLLPYTNRLPPPMDYAEGGDDGLSVLTPDRYIQVRLGDQLSYYRGKTITFERKLKLIQWSIYIIGGLGTFLAAINRQVWIALTTALASALATYLSYQQTENSLMKYNQASTDLDSIRRWWTALPAEDQGNQDNVDALVEHTEKVLQSELDGWVQQMQNALEELRKAQAPQTDEAKAAVAEAAAKQVEAAKAEKKKKVESGNVSGNAGGGGNNATTAGNKVTTVSNKATADKATTAADDAAAGHATGDNAAGDDPEDDAAEDAAADDNPKGKEEVKDKRPPPNP